MFARLDADRPLLGVVAVLAGEFQPGPPELVGEEEGIDGAEFQVLPDALLAVGGGAVVLDQFLQEPVHNVLLLDDIEAFEGFPRTLDELGKPALVRVGDVEDPDDPLLQFVVEVAACLELLLGRGRAADQYALEPLEEILLGKEDITCPIADLLVELIDGDQPQPLETDARLAALSLLAGDRRCDAVDRLDPVAPEKADVGLPPVEDDQAVDLFLPEHLLQRLELERGTAPVHVGVERLRRLDDLAIQVGAVTTDVDRAAEDCHAVLRRALIVFEAGEDGGYGTLDVRPGLFALDVGALPELVTELGGHVVYLLIGGYIQCDQLGTAPLLLRKPLKHLFKFVALSRGIHLLRLFHWAFTRLAEYCSLVEATMCFSGEGINLRTFAGLLCTRLAPGALALSSLQAPADEADRLCVDDRAVCDHRREVRYGNADDLNHFIVVHPVVGARREPLCEVEPDTLVGVAGRGVYPAHRGECLCLHPGLLDQLPAGGLGGLLALVDGACRRFVDVFIDGEPVLPDEVAVVPLDREDRNRPARVDDHSFPLLPV